MSKIFTAITMVMLLVLMGAVFYAAFGGKIPG